MERSGVDPEMIEDLILGCGNPDGFQGRNLGRQTVLRAGLPLSIAGTTITRFAPRVCNPSPSRRVASWPRAWT